ncbi:MAG: GGDEF domain-containing protein [Lachnospiraceae bacterium]|nr:GGDEF domain-containing protein [Lachnospiraceae bacterium]
MKQLKEKGVSLRKLNIVLIIIAILLAVVVAYSTRRLSQTFRSITAASEEYMKLEKAAHELMDASDYLTENVQRFTIDGDVTFLDRYFTEAFESNRREAALAKLESDERTETAREHLSDALANSMELMKREYYAMRLVVEATGCTDYPEVLDDFELSPEDEALSPEEKMRHATEMVLDGDYYELKNKIRSDMQACLDETDKILYSTEGAIIYSLKRELIVVRVVIIVQTLFFFMLIGLTARLGIRPVLRAVEKIKQDSPIPERGAREFRYLARAYNKLFTKYRSSIEKLNYKASHDKLTGAYNRAGFDHLLENLNFENVYMMLLDVDNFKSINDNYGHEAGDKALTRLVQVMRAAFRDDDYICRIGGDEFVIIMVNSGEMNQRLIESKINRINEELEKEDDGLPPMSISVGIVRGDEVTDPENLLKKTDAAMYESKKKGKHTYTFID